MATTTRIPTIDDLRVKLCYICREEEQYDDDPPGIAPRPWTHPCKCTLIAHEQCLLKWIQTAQADVGRAPNAMKCPQCGSAYELESDNPLILRLIRVGDILLRKSGTLFVIFGAATVAGLIGASVYVVCTGYGAWAVQKFIGKEMFDLLLGDDPSYWPWSAFINLPILPFSLILSQFQGAVQIPPFLPILLAMPSSLLINRRVTEYWRLPENARKLIGIQPSQISTLPDAGRSWPPSPILFALFGAPMVQMLYQRVYVQAYLKVLGTLPPERLRTRRLANRNANNINLNPNGQLNQNANANANAQFRRNNGARMNMGDGPFAIRVRAGIRDEVLDGQNNGGDDGGNEEGDRVIEINAGSMGRKVAGALLTPAIASWMGSLLLRLSRRSPLIREFLAVRSPVGRVWVPPPLDLGNRDWHSLTAFKQMTVGVQVIVRGLWGSTRTFSESDPVWWRNTVGLGLFIVAKDCFKLFYLWLSKRELASRKVKNRDFRGVDIRELDLIPNFLAGERR